MTGQVRVIMTAHGVSYMENQVDHGWRMTPRKYPGFKVKTNTKGGDNEKNT